MTVEAEKYYVRVLVANSEAFEAHLNMYGVKFTLLSVDFGTSLYSIEMNGETALSLKLSFPLVGCMNFRKTVKRQIGDLLTDQD